MSEERWMVVRCASCGNCTGHRKAPRTCTRCGQSFPRDPDVVSYAASAGELQRAVALANTPEELREELTARMGRVVEPEKEAPSPASLLDALRGATDASGVLERSAVRAVLDAKGMGQTVEGLMTMVEGEGLVIRSGHGRWQFIE